tara:strand:- start:678 stop:944 length:267 start_codon:yes stop_codon:yes gene_type:complete
MNTAKGIVSIVAAVFAFAAALLWFKSTVVKVPPNEKPNENGIIEASITSDGADVIATARKQNHWNKLGALAASIAALAQGISLLIPST